MYEFIFNEGVIFEFESHEPCFRGCVRNVKADSVLIADVDMGKSYWIEKDQLIELRESNQLKVLSTEKNLGELTFVDLTNDEQKEVQRKYKYIKALEAEEIRKVSPNNVAELLRKVSAELNEKPPSWQTLRVWYLEFIKSGRKMRSLFPKHRNKGNQNQKIHDKVLEIIRAEGKSYFSLSQPKMSTIVSAVQNKVRELNIRNPDLCLRVPSYPTVSNRVVSTIYSSKKGSRSGKRTLDAELAGYESGIETRRVLERVEIDHTQLDIHVLHDEDKTLTGRPYITVLIDHYSSMVLGFQLSFEVPSFAAIQIAALNAFLDKSELLNKLDIDVTWPAHGIPETIVADNGKEFWSENFQFVIEEIGSILQYAPIRKANYKSRVERFFGIINSMLLDDLPGVVRKLGKSGDGYDARQEAKFTFSEFKKYFVEWLTAVYHHQPLRRNSMTPYELWVESEEEFPIPKEDERMLLPILLGTRNRDLNRKGVNLFALRYESIALENLYKRAGKLRVIVKYNPFDLGEILVLDELNKVFLKAQATNYAYASGLSLYEHNQVKKKAKEIARIKLEAPNLVAAKAKLANERGQIRDRNKRRKTQVTNAKSARIDKVGSSHISLVKDKQFSEMIIPSPQFEADLDMEGWEVISDE